MTKQRCEPDGPCPCDLAVVGEAPSTEELKQNRGFCGPSGKMLWDGELNLIGGIVGRPRETCYVTNVCKIWMPEDEWQRLTYKEREPHVNSLHDELRRVLPKVVLAFGRRACSALYPGFRGIKLDQGKPKHPEGKTYIVMPLWHPAAYLRGNQEALTDLIKALAEVPNLLEHGLPMEPVTEPGSEIPPDITAEDILYYWPTTISFMKFIKEKEKTRCKLCGLTKLCARYEGRSLKWDLCRKCAVVAECWAIDNEPALYEHDTLEVDRQGVLKIERACNRLESSMRKEWDAPRTGVI